MQASYVHAIPYLVVQPGDRRVSPRIIEKIPDYAPRTKRWPYPTQMEYIQGIREILNEETYKRGDV